MGIPAHSAVRVAWMARLEADRLARIERRRAAQREADASRIEPIDVDLDAWERMRRGTVTETIDDAAAAFVARQPEPIDDEIATVSRKRALALRARYRVTMMRRDMADERAIWRPFFRQFDRSDARTWWRWRNLDRLARLRRRMGLDD